MNPKRLDDILDRMRGMRAMVVGDLILDRYLSGDVDRVSPEAPVPVVRLHERRSSLGGSGNVAANAAALGAQVEAIGCVGDDAAGREVLDLLDRSGIGISGVRTLGGRPTTEKTRIQSRHQQIVRVDVEVEDDLDDKVASVIGERIEARIAEVDVVMLEDYNKGVLTPDVIRRAIEAARAHGVPVVADPKRRNFFRFDGVTVFKPNRKELVDALGTFIHPEDEAWMEEVRSRLDCSALLVTLGSDGMALKAADQPLACIPAAARTVYDVSGAGDTVTAVVALSLAAGGSAVEAAILANHAAAIEVAMSGVATVGWEALRARLDAVHPTY